MKNVYLVQFRSTGQVWNIVICETWSTVKRVMSQHEFDLIYSSDDSEFFEFVNPKDSSQSATVSRKRVVE
jgi:hypothetical protein